jgi:hypothetical protein
MIDGSYEALRSGAVEVETLEVPGTVTRIIGTAP